MKDLGVSKGERNGQGKEERGRAHFYPGKQSAVELKYPKSLKAGESERSCDWCEAIRAVGTRIVSAE
jgi:hypothetical protein